MTDNVPLVFDSQNNTIKELPVGNNLDCTGSSIVAVKSLTVNGAITTNSITVNNQTLSAVAFSNDFNDLNNTPQGFTGDYNDLTNLPAIPQTIRNLTDIDEQEPADGQALIYNATSMTYEPESIIDQSAIDQITLGSLSNVVTQGSIVTNKFLKFTAGAWRPSKVTYGEIENRPLKVSFFENDSGYLTAEDIQGIQGDFIGSVFGDDSTLLVDGVKSVIPYNVLDGAPTALSDLSNDLDYASIVGSTIENNGLPVLPTQKLDISGSVFGDDSTLLVDGVNSTLPYTASQPTDWEGTAPDTVYEALDRIAAALTALGQQA